MLKTPFSYKDINLSVDERLQIAISLHKDGQLDCAKDAYEYILSMKEDDYDSTQLLGVLAFQQNRFLDAVNYFSHAISIAPHVVDAHFKLGLVHQHLKQFKDASVCFSAAIELSPQYAQAHASLGLTYHAIGRYESALLCLEEALRLSPEIPEVYVSHGATMFELKRFEDAVRSFDKALSLNPKLVNAHNNRGISLKALKKFGAAKDSLDMAIRLNPNYAAAYSNRGLLFRETQKIDEAISDLNKAIQLNPNYPQAHCNLGVVHVDLGRYEAAIKCYDEAIRLRPDYVEALCNRGIALRIVKRYSDSIASYQRAMEIRPDFADTFSNLGNALQDLGRVEEAISNFDHAIKLNPKFGIAYANRASSLRLLCRYVDAIASVGKALELNPSLPVGLQNYSSMLSHLSDYREVCKYSDAALERATPETLEMIWEVRLYSWIYHPDLSAQEICAEHQRWGSQFAGLGIEGFGDHDRTPTRRLRVGYVSPDFRGHTCRFYFEPLFSQHDHTHFEVFAYSNVLIEDEHTHRLKPYFDQWRSILGLSDEAAAQMIRQDKIDILVDACGHMVDTRLRVFAHKPAPIQVTWLGAAWTTGLPQMDYVLFDPYMAPPGTATSEQIIRLPRTWAAFRPGQRALGVEVSESAAAKSGHITFGYSGRSERLNYRVFRAWGRILSRLPQARLILDYKAFADSKNQAYYREFLQTHGVDTSRVQMRNSENIFEGLADVDILLDSFPHSGGTMLFDALWMGVPAVTLASERPVGRIGTSLMSNLGLSQWVAQSEQDYEDKAVAFAQNIPALEVLRSTLRSRMQGSPLMDERSFARDVEAAYQGMWLN